MDNVKKAPVILVVFSALSFIPLIGVVFGIISLIIGLINFKRFKLIFILGASGIGFTILLFSIIVIVIQKIEKSGKVDQMLTQTTEMFLNNLSNELENYKCKYGSYPDSLEQIKQRNSLAVITDMYSAKTMKKTDIKKHKRVGNFYYKVENDTFVLFSVGKDGIPFTKDDIFPHDKKIKPIGK